MPDLFGIDLAGILADAFAAAGGLRPATLVKMTPGTRTVLGLAGGTNATTTSYTTEGTLETRTDLDPGTMTRRERQVVTLLGAALTTAGVVPAAGDQVTIEGATYAIAAVTRDPAAASYSCTVAGV